MPKRKTVKKKGSSDPKPDLQNQGSENSSADLDAIVEGTKVVSATPQNVLFVFVQISSYFNI